MCEAVSRTLRRFISAPDRGCAAGIPSKLSLAHPNGGYAALGVPYTVISIARLHLLEAASARLYLLCKQAIGGQSSMLIILDAI